MAKPAKTADQHCKDSGALMRTTRGVRVRAAELRSLRGLFPERRHVLCGDLSRFAAEACGDVIGHGRNLDIGIGVAERWHRDRTLRRLSLGSGNHDLGDI